MPLSINLSFTDTAQAAIFNFTKTGVALNFTHIQIGAGNKAPTGTETALLQPKLASPIAGGSQPSPTQIRMAAVLSGSTSFNISEVGMWAGDPAVAGSKLLAYWSQASGFIAVKSPGVDFVFSYDMVLNTAAPLGAINIIADPSISAIIAAITAHEAKNDPHPQYTTPDEVVALVEARVHDSVLDTGPVNAAKVALNPPIGAYTVATEFTFKSANTNTGAMTIDAGAGAKPLVREDGQPMQAGDIAANVMVPVLFDVSAQAFRVLDKVNSQINDRIDAKVVTHKADPDPHPQYTTDAEVRALIEARVGDYVNATGTGAAYVAVLNPPVTAYDANTAFAFKVPATNTGAVTLDAGGGAKPLVREDGAAMQAGDTPAGAVLTVVYDVSTTSFRSTEMVNSQANALIDDKMVAHRAEADPHSQYETSLEAAAKIAAHKAETDPHSQYATDTDLTTGLAARLPLTGGRLSGDLTLDGAPDGNGIRRLYISEFANDSYGGVLGYDSVLDQLFLATRNASTADVKALTIARGGTGINVPGVLTQAGSQVLSIANFNTYTPTLTGGGATGKWTIDINGNANTATFLNTASSATPLGSLLGRINSGFYEYSSPTTANGWPINGNFMHLWANTHSNTANNFSSQFAADFFSNNLWYRSTNNNGLTPWVKIITSEINTYLKSRGNEQATAVGNTRGSVAGLSMVQAYTNGYPTDYGNVIHTYGIGAGQLLIGWSGQDGAHADNYIRSKRDNDAGPWSPWAKILTDQNIGGVVPAGLRMLWHSSVPPTGYLICDGSAVSRTAYASLFNAISTFFGAGDGSTTFNLPDHRNRTHMGAGSTYASGQVGGTADAILPLHNHFVDLTGTAASGGAHTHTYKTYGLGNSGLQGNANTNWDWGWASTGNPANTVEGAHDHSVRVSGQTLYTGQSGVGANLPPFIASYVIIKY